MTVNLFGRDASFAAQRRRASPRPSAPTAVWSLQPTREGNTVVLALQAAPTCPIATSLPHARKTSKARFGLPARKWLRMVRALPAELTG